MVTWRPPVWVRACDVALWLVWFGALAMNGAPDGVALAAGMTALGAPMSVQQHRLAVLACDDELVVRNWLGTTVMRAGDVTAIEIVRVLGQWTLRVHCTDGRSVTPHVLQYRWPLFGERRRAVVQRDADALSQWLVSRPD